MVSACGALLFFRLHMDEAGGEAVDRFDVIYRWVMEEGGFEELLADYLAGLPEHRRHWAAVVARQVHERISRDGGLEALRELQSDPELVARRIAMDYMQ